MNMFAGTFLFELQETVLGLVYPTMMEVLSYITGESRCGWQVREESAD